jgi:hypothetical protein
MTQRTGTDWDDLEFERLLRSIEHRAQLDPSDRDRIRRRVVEGLRSGDEHEASVLVFPDVGTAAPPPDSRLGSRRMIATIAAAALLVIGGLGAVVALVAREEPAGPASPVDRSYTSEVLGTPITVDLPVGLEVSEEVDGVLAVSGSGRTEPDVVVVRPRTMSSSDVLRALGDPDLAAQYQQRDVAGARAEVAVVSVTSSAAESRACAEGASCVELIDDPSTSLRADTLHEVSVIGQGDLPPIVVITFGGDPDVAALVDSISLGEPAPPR